MSDLISVQTAKKNILEKIHPLEKILQPLQDSSGFILAEDVHSPVNFPHFANSSMDGFAIISADLKKASPDQPVTLKIVEDIPAGKIPTISVEFSQAARIMTGAMLPQGADSVIPLELTTESPAGNEVLCFATATPGENIRPIAYDFHQGDLLLTSGIRLTPRHLALLSSLGLVSVPVHRQPRVAIFSTGSELSPAGSHLDPGRLIDSNSVLLSSLVQEINGLPISLGIAKDDRAEIRAIFEKALNSGADLIISSAGVSVGKYDYIKEIIPERGEIKFWRVNLRPGKPFTFGSYAGIPFLGMPGNPVSSFVTFLLFAKPVIQKLLGTIHPKEQYFTGTLTEPANSDGRESYLRAVAFQSSSGEISVKPTDSHQGSGNLFGLANSNALLIVPNGVKSLPIGTTVHLILLDEFIEG